VAAASPAEKPLHSNILSFESQGFMEERSDLDSALDTAAILPAATAHIRGRFRALLDWVLAQPGQAGPSEA
jgi:hypothetical protein